MPLLMMMRVSCWVMKVMKRYETIRLGLGLWREDGDYGWICIDGTAH
jgi:hypothetical protein